MKKIKNRITKQKFRLFLTVLLLAFLAGNFWWERADVQTGTSAEVSELYAWWGTMYPEFCFHEGVEKDGISGEDEPEVKISFWLAKAFDW